MKAYIDKVGALLAALAIASLCANAASAQVVIDNDTIENDQGSEVASGLERLPWPQKFSRDGDGFTVYPPQLDRWEGNRLVGRTAVAVQQADAEKPVFGVVSFSARTQVDHASQTVTVRDLAVTTGSFPTAPQRAGAYLDAVRQHLSALSWAVSVERLRSDLAIDQAAQQARSQPLHNDPPRIVYSASPALLVPIDGEPVLRAMAGLDLERVLNTRALIVLEKATGRYFLFAADRWFEAPSVDGPWTVAKVRPMALEEAKQQAIDSDEVDLLESDDADDGRTPAVIVSTQPTELVQTDGPPQYSPIEGTQLLYVTNTPNRLFLDLATQQYYVLLAGRWYRSRALERSAWTYVAGNDVPADFAMIPATHPTESVRAAVAGTPQAQEAAIVNSVPEVAAVKRSDATLDITYDGTPQFRPIEGTILESAVNAPVPVIRVDGRSYYALDNGVWFFSSSPDGPWTTAASVPSAIYRIPRSHPLHYVTYVRVYDATDDDVYVGYTPGYVGSYVTTDSTVVYGSGWYYRPWIGTVWYGPPVTWGFGFTYWNTWWNPWPWRPWWGPAWGWKPFPVKCFRPWWGPWHARPGFVAGRPKVSVVAGGSFATGAAPRAAGSRLIRGKSINANTASVTNIYRRWGPRVAVANATPGRPPARAGGMSPVNARSGSAARSGNPDWQVLRQRNGQWQRFAGNGRWEDAPGPDAARGSGRQNSAPTDASSSRGGAQRPEPHGTRRPDRAPGVALNQPPSDRSPNVRPGDDGPSARTPEAPHPASPGRQGSVRIEVPQQQVPPAAGFNRPRPPAPPRNNSAMMRDPRAGGPTVQPYRASPGSPRAPYQPGPALGDRRQAPAAAYPYPQPRASPGAAYQPATGFTDGPGNRAAPNAGHRGMSFSPQRFRSYQQPMR